MERLSSVEELRRWREANNALLALVPTMGALHAGHLALVQEARRYAPRVLVSIFVNPLQFGANEDFGRYPRTFEADCALLEAAGVNAVYAPDMGEMYPQGFQTSIHLSEITQGLCGAYRPGHFDGVATVVAKLFMQSGAQIACFGEKDYQQLCLIRRMVEDLSLPVEIIGVPTLREADGLAMSSRNRYLDSRQREQAARLPALMRESLKALKDGNAVKPVLAQLMQGLLDAGFAKVDYAEFCDARTLEPLMQVQPSARLLVAAHLGATRLIDNMPYGQ